MDNLVNGLLVAAGIIGILFVAAFLWEFARRTYYWTAAKIFGWSEEEKFERETAWIDRAVARDERLAKKEAEAAANISRKWLGVTRLSRHHVSHRHSLVGGRNRRSCIRGRLGDGNRFYLGGGILEHSEQEKNGLSVTSH
jgi:hypothetical protein